MGCDGTIFDYLCKRYILAPMINIFIDHVLGRRGKTVGGMRDEARSRRRSSIRSLAFLNLRNAQTIEQTTASAGVSSPSASNRY